MKTEETFGHKLDLKEYRCFRTYLKDYYQSIKQQHSHYTWEKFAEALSIGASQLKMVVSGKRNLALDDIYALTLGLGLTEEEAEYFHQLVNFTQATRESTRQQIARRLEQYTQGPSSGFYVRTPSKEFLEKWYTPLLLVAALEYFGKADKPFGELPAECLGNLSTRLRVDANELAAHWRDLADLAKGLKPDTHIKMEKIAGSISKKRFLKENLRKVSEMVDARFEDERSYFGHHILSMSPEQLAEFQKRYLALIHEFSNLKSEDKDLRPLLVLANAQIFPF